jgi:hypothetical protein
MPFAWQAAPHSDRDGKRAMKIYLLFILISIFVGIPYFPARREATESDDVSRDSLAA